MPQRYWRPWKSRWGSAMQSDESGQRPFHNLRSRFSQHTNVPVDRMCLGYPHRCRPHLSLTTLSIHPFFFNLRSQSVCLVIPRFRFPLSARYFQIDGCASWKSYSFACGIDTASKAETLLLRGDPTDWRIFFSKIEVGLPLARTKRKTVQTALMRPPNEGTRAHPHVRTCSY